MNSTHQKQAGTVWQRLVRIFERNPPVQKLRFDTRHHNVSVGFYNAPSKKSLEQVESAVRRELPADWDVSVDADGESAVMHLHKIDKYTREIHRAHGADEPPVVWRRIALPAWRNRPFPRAVARDYRSMLLLAAICGAGALSGFALERSESNTAFVAVCFTIAYVAGGWFATQDMWHALKRRTIDIQFLMVAVAVGAFFVCAQTEGATLLFLFSLSNGLEQFANHRTRKSIESLLKVAPKQVLRREDNHWVQVAVEQVRVGDELLVKPGELFPVDGEIIEGATSVDESALTGEAIPVAKQAGDAVDGGTLNLEGRSIIRATRELEQSALSRIVALIEQAEQQKAPAQRFTDRFSRYYTWVALTLAGAVFVTLLMTGRPAAAAFYRAMTVLVVASPCALVLSIPSAILVAIAAGARRGILFRGGVAIENLAGANRFAFDKTGTLTSGALVVVRISAFDSQDEDGVLQAAASVAHSSTHPLARAIGTEAEVRRVSLSAAQDFLNVPGLGMEATVNGQRLFVGSRKFMHDRGVPLPVVEVTTDAEVWIGSSQLLGVIYLRDEIRPASKRVIDFLRRCGSSVTLLTGDRAGPAAMIAQQAGIDDVRPELSPQAKLKCIHDWRAAGERVAMVGDGINDAPSLTAADVSIGMGARGSDAALEQADIILMHDKIDHVEDAFRLSRRARAIIRQNTAISLGVVLFLIVSALAEKINLTAGVIGHEGSTVAVILNGLRLLRRTRGGD